MNMMSWQDRAEELAVPEFVRDLERDYAQFEGKAEAEAASAAAPVEQASLLERLAWFRNLSLARKINAVFGTFLGAGVLMVLVLGLGLGELWNRYNASARIQETLVAAGQLQMTAGELRYHSVRALYDPSAATREAQRASEAAVTSQVAAIEAAIAAEAPELAPRAKAVRAEVTRFETAYDTASDTVRGGGNAGRLARLNRSIARTIAPISSCRSAPAISKLRSPAARRVMPEVISTILREKSRDR